MQIEHGISDAESDVEKVETKIDSTENNVEKPDTIKGEEKTEGSKKGFFDLFFRLNLFFITFRIRYSSINNTSTCK